MGAVAVAFEFEDVAFDSSSRGNVKQGEVFGVEADFEGGERLAQVIGVAGAHDGRRHVRLRENPGDADGRAKLRPRSPAPARSIMARAI